MYYHFINTKRLDICTFILLLQQLYFTFANIYFHKVHKHHPVNSTIFQFRRVLFQKYFTPAKKANTNTHAKYSRKTTWACRCWR